jgi:hypothetical protein
MELTPKQLLNVFTNVGREPDQCIERRGSVEELVNFQLEIAFVKDALYKKAKLKSRSTFQEAYFTLFLS